MTGLMIETFASHLSPEHLLIGQQTNVTVCTCNDSAKEAGAH